MALLRSSSSHSSYSIIGNLLPILCVGQHQEALYAMSCCYPIGRMNQHISSHPAKITLDTRQRIDQHLTRMVAMWVRPSTRTTRAALDLVSPFWTCLIVSNHLLWKIKMKLAMFWLSGIVRKSSKLYPLIALRTSRELLWNRDSSNHLLYLTLKIEEIRLVLTIGQLWFWKTNLLHKTLKPKGEAKTN